MKGYIAVTRIYLKLALREKGVLFFNYVFPLIFFFTFGAFMGAQSGGITQIVTMVLVIGILGSGLFGAGMRAVAEREANILRRYKVAPITPAPLLVGQMITGWLLYLPSVIIVLTLAHFMYGMPVPARLLSLLVMVTIGAISMRSIGLIVASVVNSVAESNIMIQILYMPMLFLSGATFPLSILPFWAQITGQFLPATHLYNGMQGIMLRNETIGANWQAAGALIITALVGMFISMKLFRWEKEQKIPGKARVWILAVLSPFILLGGYQAYSKQNIERSKMFERDLRRNHTWLIRGARVITGDGQVIENGGLLIKDGKIVDIYNGNIPDAKAVKADGIDAYGKTILPGLIDVHVHLGADGGIRDEKAMQEMIAETQQKDYRPGKSYERALEQYLYSGVTAVKSVGDFVDMTLKARDRINSGEILGAQLFVCGPLFTTEGGHGTEYFKNAPETFRKYAEGQFLRMPKNAQEAAEQVHALKLQGVDGIKAIMEAGGGNVHFNRMDPAILRAIGEQAHKDNLPLAVHTGDIADIQDAIAAGAASIEHGSTHQKIPDEIFAEMAKKHIAFDPTLTVVDAFIQFNEGKTDLLDRSLVAQVVPNKVLQATRAGLTSQASAAMRKSIGSYPMALGIVQDNLLRAYKAGVMVVTGSDAGNYLVFHGPTVQRELQLWTQAGVPAAAAIQGATYNAAKLLRIDDHTGAIRKGYDATLLMVDGNPLQDISAMERISTVYFRGEHVNRSDLFDQK